MIVAENTTSTFTPPDAGTYTAVMRAMIDLGTQSSTFEGETKTARKIMLKFEITDPDNRRQDGTAHTVSKRFTASLHERAALRKFLEAWRGRPFTPEELKGFAMTKLLGQPCLLGIVHQEREGKVFAGISSCMKLPKGMTAPPASEALEHWDMSGSVPPDWTVFASLPKRLQETIEATAEFARLQQPKSVAVAPQAAPQHAAAPAPMQPHALPAGAGASGFDDFDEIAF